MRGKRHIALIAAALIVPAVIQAGQEDDVVARIGDEVVTRGNIEQEYAGIRNLQRWGRNPDQFYETVREVVERKVLAKSARQEGLEKDPELKFRIERQIETMLAEAYRGKLEREIQAAVTVEKDEVRRYYEKHQENYKKEGKVQLLYIAMRHRSEAERIAKQLKKGADFTALAREHSIHPSARMGGDLGWIPYGRLNRLQPAIGKAVQGLQEGETSGVLQTKDGFCLVRVVKREPPGTVPLEEVAGQIDILIRNKKEHTRLQNALAEQMRAMDAEILIEKGGIKAPSR